MHDCFGKPITPFCRVRAATKEELEKAGHPEAAWPATLSPAEQFALPGQFQSDTCNVHVVPSYSFSPISTPTPGAMPEVKLYVPAWPTLCTARALVRLA
jgi:hypothetical protein